MSVASVPQSRGLTLEGLMVRFILRLVTELPPVDDPKLKKIRDNMVFPASRLKPGKPSPKALEKARSLPPFLIRVF